VVVVGVVCGLVGVVVAVLGVVVVGVVWGLVGVVAVEVVVVWVLAVEVAVDAGWMHIASACLRRFAMPIRSCARKPLSTVAGSARKSSSVFPSADSVVAQLPFPDAAACATASKSPRKGPALADGIRPLPELPQDTSMAAAAPSSATTIRRMRVRMLTDRTPGAPRASSADALL
jgi:hypothetical protein